MVEGVGTSLNTKTSLLLDYIMNTGKVKFYNETKGFGFIMDDQSGEEYFVHASGLDDHIGQDDHVQFELKEGRKGLNAVNVRQS